MSNEQWTPGPWASNCDDTNWFLESPDGPVLGASYLGNVEVYNPNDMPMLSAAPRLYEALKTLLDSYGYTSYLSEEERLSDPDVEEAIEALMEARGETR